MIIEELLCYYDGMYNALIDMSEQIGRGWNIKCFDKVKITHLSTSCRLHANSFAYKSKSYNTAVTCHKVRDDSDWFCPIYSGL